jgi:signal peptidase I
MRKWIALLLVLFLTSCSSLNFWPFGSKKTTDTEAKKTAKAESIKPSKGEPKPGDINVIDGVEYIYAKNRRYMSTPYEPEYIWVRKDQYSPGLFDSLRSRSPAPTKEEKEMEARIAKLEEDLKKRGVAPQMAYPPQMVYMPNSLGYPAPLPTLTFSYPSPKMKRRVIILPLEDQTNYKNEHLGELATQRLVSKLESTGTIISVDPTTLGMTGPITDPKNMKALSELYSVQAVVTGVISDVYTSTSKVEGKDERETSFAVSKIALNIYNTDTGVLLRTLTGRNPVYLSRERGEMSPEKAKVRAIDLAIELIAEDVLRPILTLDWYARVGSLEQERVFLTAGRLSGLEKGDVLEVYTPGQTVFDAKTHKPLGTTKGEFRGEVEVVELFGVDAAAAKVKSGGKFAATDFVYLKKQS